MPRGKRSLPEGITFKGTHRQFKQQKRAELRALKSAFKKVQHGCALTPIRRVELPSHHIMTLGSSTRAVYIGDVGDVLDEWIKACSVKNWGR
jgi:hypothetical protein